MNLSDAIAAMALIVSGISLYVSLRQNRNNEQIRIIEKRKELISSYQRCADAARRCRMSIEEVRSSSPAEVRARFERKYSEACDKLSMHEKNYREYETIVRKLKFGERHEPQWRKVKLEMLVQEFRLITEGLDRDIEGLDKRLSMLKECNTEAHTTLGQPSIY